MSNFETIESYEGTANRTAEQSNHENQNDNTTKKQSPQYEAAEPTREKAEAPPSDQDVLKEAEQNIQKYRTREMEIDGLQPDTEYRIEQQSYDFPFGTEINARLLFSSRQELEVLARQAIKQYPARENEIRETLAQWPNAVFVQNYRRTAETYFNGTVEANAFKWQFTYGLDGKRNWELADKTMDYLRQHSDILDNFRGHCVFWNHRKIYLPLCKMPTRKKSNRL